MTRVSRSKAPTTATPINRKPGTKMRRAGWRASAITAIPTHPIATTSTVSRMPWRPTVITTEWVDEAETADAHLAAELLRAAAAVPHFRAAEDLRTAHFREHESLVDVYAASPRWGSRISGNSNRSARVLRPRQSPLLRHVHGHHPHRAGPVRIAQPKRIVGAYLYRFESPPAKPNGSSLKTL